MIVWREDVNTEAFLISRRAGRAPSQKRWRCRSSASAIIPRDSSRSLTRGSGAPSREAMARVRTRGAGIDGARQGARGLWRQGSRQCLCVGSYRATASVPAQSQGLWRCGMFHSAHYR
jgi:hypothetical protein